MVRVVRPGCLAGVLRIASRCVPLTTRQCSAYASPRALAAHIVPSFLPANLSPLPPWLVLAGLLGVINAAACFMLIGRRVSRLGPYAALGMFAACLGQVVGAAVQAPGPLMIGDLNVLAASVGACAVVLAARLV